MADNDKEIDFVTIFIFCHLILFHQALVYPPDNKKEGIECWVWRIRRAWKEEKGMDLERRLRTLRSYSLSSCTIGTSGHSFSLKGNNVRRKDQSYKKLCWKSSQRLKPSWATLQLTSYKNSIQQEPRKRNKILLEKYSILFQLFSWVLVIEFLWKKWRPQGRDKIQIHSNIRNICWK